MFCYVMFCYDDITAAVEVDWEFVYIVWGGRKGPPTKKLQNEQSFKRLLKEKIFMPS